MSIRRISPSFVDEVKEVLQPPFPTADEPAFFVGYGSPSTGTTQLTAPDNAVLDLDSSNFTIECWFRISFLNSSLFSPFLYKGSLSFVSYYVQMTSTSTRRLQAFVSFDGSNTNQLQSLSTLSDGVWYHFALTRFGDVFSLWLDGKLQETKTLSGSLYNSGQPLIIGGSPLVSFRGTITNLRILKGTSLYNSDFTVPKKPLDVIANTSLLTCCDLTYRDRSRNNLTITPSANTEIQSTSGLFADLLPEKLRLTTSSGNLFTNDIPSTYSLVYTHPSGSESYFGGVLAPNGDIHFVPDNATVGQKISSSGTVSTYSLVYTTDIGFHGGVLAPNGDIQFIPHAAIVGQKINSSGVLSTYVLVADSNGGFLFSGGALNCSGDIHFVPYSGGRGQKVSSSGVVSTYSLVYTTSSAYSGGILDTNGDIHFIPHSAARGQKISATGVVSTYSLVYTTTIAYQGGVLAPNGDIHFIPHSAARGQKISATGVVSTYSLVYTTTIAYSGGILAPNGDIHFVPYSASVGQKVSAAGIVSTYSLVYTTVAAYSGGVLTENGDILFIPARAAVGQKISINSGVQFSKGVCISPYFNKF